MNWDLIISILVVVACFIVIEYDLRCMKPKPKTKSAKSPAVKTNEGFVYIISNLYYKEGVFKIGLTTQDVNSRKSQLFTTGVPIAFDTCMVIRTDDCRALERKLHAKYASKRITSRREWFILSHSDIRDIFLRYRDDVVLKDDAALKMALGSLYVPEDRCVAL